MARRSFTDVFNNSIIPYISVRYIRIQTGFPFNVTPRTTKQRRRHRRIRSLCAGKTLYTNRTNQSLIEIGYSVLLSLHLEFVGRHYFDWAWVTIRDGNHCRIDKIYIYIGILGTARVFYAVGIIWLHTKTYPEMMSRKIFTHGRTTDGRAR